MRERALAPPQAANARASAATIEAHIAEGYTKGSSSDRPPAANADTRTWSFRKSVFFSATRIPFARTISAAPIPGQAFRDRTSPTSGSSVSATSLSGTSPLSQGPMRRADSAASTRATAAARSAAVTDWVCSLALTTQESAVRRREAQEATSAGVMPGSKALLTRASTSWPAGGRSERAGFHAQQSTAQQSKAKRRLAATYAI